MKVNDNMYMLKIPTKMHPDKFTYPVIIFNKGKMLLVAYDKNGIVKETTVLTPRKLTEFIGNKYLYDRYYEPCTGWQEVDGTKYHFDADGKMTTGWLEENDSWYYLDKDGQKNNWLVNIKW